MPYTLIGTRFTTPFEPPYGTPEHKAACVPGLPCGHPDKLPHHPYRSLDEAKAAAEANAGVELSWYERTVRDGLGPFPWRGEPHLCAWNLDDHQGPVQYLITDGICWIGWRGDPALAGYNAAMRHMGRPEMAAKG